MRAMGISLYILLMFSFHAEAKFRAAGSFTAPCARTLASVNNQSLQVSGYEVSSNLLSRWGMSQKFLEELLSNKIGIPVSEGSRNYELLLSEDEIKVYKIKVYRNIESKKEIITEVTPSLSLHDQLIYYKALAEQVGYKTFEFKVKLGNHDTYAYIGSHVQAKMKFKHKVSVQDVMSVFKDQNWHQKMILDRDNFLLKKTDAQGRTLKVIFALNESKVKIITAFFSYNN